MLSFQHVANIKIISDLIYFPLIMSSQSVLCFICTTSSFQFKLATFPVLNGPVCLLAAILDNRD